LRTDGRVSANRETRGLRPPLRGSPQAKLTLISSQRLYSVSSDREEEEEIEEEEIEERQSRGSFRFNAKKAGLTWSCPKRGACRELGAGEHAEDCACEHPIKEFKTIIEFLMAKGHCKYIVAKEKHKNGTIHWHGYVDYDQKQDSRDTRFFDILGVHPNIIAKPGKGWQGYCAGQNGEKESSIEWQSNFYKRDCMTEAMAMETWEEAKAFLFKERPTDTARNMRNYKWAYEEMHKSKPVARTERRFTKPYERPSNTHCIMVRGPAGKGKTQWAERCFKNPLTVSQVEDLKDLNKEHDGILYDDFDANHLSRTVQIHLVDVEMERSIPCRYGNAKIPRGMPRMWTYNTGFAPIALADAAIERRVKEIVIDEDIRVMDD